MYPSLLLALFMIATLAPARSSAETFTHSSETRAVELVPGIRKTVSVRIVEPMDEMRADVDAPADSGKMVRAVGYRGIDPAPKELRQCREDQWRIYQEVLRQTPEALPRAHRLRIVNLTILDTRRTRYRSRRISNELSSFKPTARSDSMEIRFTSRGCQLLSVERLKQELMKLAPRPRLKAPVRTGELPQQSESVKESAPSSQSMGKTSAPQAAPGTQGPRETKESLFR